MSRYLTERVKTAKKRKPSSTKWLQRQLNDDYVKEAKALGYRSRAAFKLIEIDDKYKILKKGQIVIDLGAAPGGWTQVAAERIDSSSNKIRVFGLDILPIKPMDNAAFIQMDFMEDEADKALIELVGSKVDVVLSDMAANTTGVHDIDHMRIMAMLEYAFAFAKDILKENGTFMAKIFQGGTEAALLAEMKNCFNKVIHVKPKASRADSSEFYVLATGFKDNAG